MSIADVRRYFDELGLADRILEFEVSSATVALAAQAVGCAEKEIAKTLSFKLNDRVILVVTAGDAKVSNAKYKAHFGGKASMLSPDEAVSLVGHAVGGVCPFAVKEGVEIYLDESLRRFERVYPACGSSNSAIPLNLDELMRYAKARAWIDVCKDWDGETV